MMYVSEQRPAGISDDEKGVISPGFRTICYAMATISTSGQGKADDHQLQVKVKLDSCGSVSIAHSDHLIKLKKAKDYGLQNIRLLGIGGKTNFLTKVGVLPVHKPDGDVCCMLCYAFDSPLGDTDKVILLGLHTIMMKANINILQHMKDSLEGNCSALAFWPLGESFDEAVKELSAQDDIKRVFRMRTPINPRDVYISTSEYDEVTELDLVNLAINHIETGSTIMEEAYMKEIQFRRIVDRTSQEEGKQLSDGDEVMIKDGVTISKFSKETMGLGKDVYDEEGTAPIILKKVYILYDKYVGPDSVFPVSNGAPRIMTKFKDQP
jgi:hypothetical protein